MTIMGTTVSGPPSANVQTATSSPATAAASPVMIADPISVHVNTAHYRLNKIGDLTHSDLRRLKDVLDLVVAIRFAMSRGERPPGVWR